MKKIYNLIVCAIIACMGLGMSSCEGEKDLIVIDPVPLKALYMLGDATPAGWDKDAPTPLTTTAADRLTFTYEGLLNVGEVKFPHAIGSWSCPYYLAPSKGFKIGREGLIDGEMIYSKNGKPDNKWKITEAGIYRISINTQHETITVTYLGEE